MLSDDEEGSLMFIFSCIAIPLPRLHFEEMLNKVGFSPADPQNSSPRTSKPCIPPPRGRSPQVGTLLLSRVEPRPSSPNLLSGILKEAWQISSKAKARTTQAEAQAARASKKTNEALAWKVATKKEVQSFKAKVKSLEAKRLIDFRAKIENHFSDINLKPLDSNDEGGEDGAKVLPTKVARIEEGAELGRTKDTSIENVSASQLSPMIMLSEPEALSKESNATIDA
ncbi:hypothetical protein COCNU_05G004240 [Cocos nucifera]|uniref:Uncharacterized protein n=1 Tax=Cocos nucifera TaxID=13894 RepID=A0A8K0I870_COCNU|nr:hypothetical protein COCNU_05G004240 [Cocos nucifera]